MDFERFFADVRRLEEIADELAAINRGEGVQDSKAYRAIMAKMEAKQNDIRRGLSAIVAAN